ncbi:hypothetical protein A2U01_0084404, partial [Trifolium medium]|nr:hypothetical protein [Trifolium medium]
ARRATTRRKSEQDRATLRAALALAACRADTRSKNSLEPKHYASRQRQKPNRLSQQERRVVPDASARRARGRK